MRRVTFEKGCSTVAKWSRTGLCSPRTLLRPAEGRGGREGDRVEEVLIAGALALAAGPLAVAGWASAEPANPQRLSGATSCNDGTVNWSPTQLWPPNHKPQSIAIFYNENGGDGDGDTIGVTVKSVRAFPANTDASGAGHTSPDSSYDASTEKTAPDTGTAYAGTLKVLSERSGHDIGRRTYVIQVECSDSGGSDVTEMGGETQDVMICVSVPHDQHHPIVQDGAGCMGTITSP